MPSKQDLKKAERKGVSPYAIAQSMINKGKISPQEKEKVVKGITRSAIAKKK